MLNKYNRISKNLKKKKTNVKKLYKIILRETIAKNQAVKMTGIT